MQPGDSFARVVFVTDASTGAPVTGLLITDFTITGYVNGNSVAIAVTSLTELGGGEYRIAFNLAQATGYHDYRYSVASSTVSPTRMEGEIENNDLDSIASRVSAESPSIILSPQGDLTIRVWQNDYREISIPITDDDGNPVYFADLDTWIFGVRDAEQQTTFTLTSAGGEIINDPSSGNPLVLLPETASFYSQLPAGTSQVTLYWSIQGDDASPAKTATRRAGQLIVRRQEVT